jgi:predicted flap endonuclease-1-like 5' DNA nuclease
MGKASLFVESLLPLYNTRQKLRKAYTVMKIILIHGQGRTPLSMSLLGRRLNQHDYPVHYFAYVSAWESFDGITARLARMIRQEVGLTPYAIVSHSLGGLLTRNALPHLNENPPRHLIMLASPNQPARMAKLGRLNLCYRLATGDCGRKLADAAFYRTLPYPAIPTTIIAGDSGPRSAFLPLGTAENDGVLTVAETGLGQGYEQLVVPALHPFIMNSAEATRLILEILARAEPAQATAPIAPADDLRKIEGIGPKIAEVLQAAGLDHFDQLAATPVSRLQEILRLAGSRYRLADPASWPEQAALAAAGNWTALAELQGRLKGGRPDSSS